MGLKSYGCLVSGTLACWRIHRPLIASSTKRCRNVGRRECNSSNRSPMAKESEMANTQAIDHVLRQAVHAQDVPGVVAMAATDQGILYEGAFGTRALGTDAAM